MNENPPSRRSAASRLWRHMRSLWKHYAVAGGIVAVTLFLLFVLPTVYYYRSQKTKWGNLIRIHRITQGVDVLRRGEWVSLKRLEEEAEASELAKIVPHSELVKIRLQPPKLRRNNDGNWRLDYRFYNGTKRNLKYITVAICFVTPTGEYKYEQDKALIATGCGRSTRWTKMTIYSLKGPAWLGSTGTITCRVVLIGALWE